MLVHVSPVRETLFTVDADERSLILSAQGGDVGAFSALVERYWARLVPFARSLVGDGEAEDAVQDSLVSAWRKLSSLREPDAFSAWIFRIVSRRCYRMLRHRALLAPLSALSDRSNPGNDQGLERLSVERILEGLPPRLRAAMHLTVIEGMSDSEIGAAMKITAAAVRSHRRRARDRLRHLLRAPRKAGGTES